VTIVGDDRRTDDLRWMPNVRELVEDEGLDFGKSLRTSRCARRPAAPCSGATSVQASQSQ
jgi:hypothetical protein